jgi:hypothetical protein
MPPNEATDSNHPLPEQADSVTDSMTPPRELANEFHKVIDKREQLRDQPVKESV